MLNKELKVYLPARQGDNSYHRAKLSPNENGYTYALYSYENNIESLVGFGIIPERLHDTITIFASHTNVDKALVALREYFYGVLNNHIKSVTFNY